MTTLFSSVHNLEIELKFKPSEEQMFLLSRAMGDPHLNDDAIIKDTYLFGPSIMPLESGGYKTMKQYLRIRREGDASYVALKKRSDEGVVELETRVNNFAIMETIFSTLGYGGENNVVQLKKKRETYKVTFEGFDLDVVFDQFSFPEHMAQMGIFVEIELKSSVDSYDEGIAILKRFLFKHGIGEIQKYPPYIEIALNPEMYKKKIQKICCQ